MEMIKNRNHVNGNIENKKKMNRYNLEGCKNVPNSNWEDDKWIT